MLRFRCLNWYLCTYINRDEIPTTTHINVAPSIGNNLVKLGLGW